eukprot:m.237551 g.237551  ORF g.237551 m.237551 type:complete len:71 (-) comp17110_c0_seq3:224-436(-)
MPIGLGEALVIGAVAVTVFVGPKRVLPKVAEALKTARQALNETKSVASQANKVKDAVKGKGPEEPPSSSK